MAQVSNDEEFPTAVIEEEENYNKKEKKHKKKHKKDKKKKNKDRKKKKRRNHQSHGNHAFGRRESTPHHSTVASLASIKSPMVMSKLNKMSQDLKYHRELQKVLMELKQKDEDYRYAIEIGESLTKENTFLKDQIEDIESKLNAQESDNIILKEKLSALSSTYHEDIQKYHQELEEYKELSDHLNNLLKSKENELSLQQDINQKNMTNINEIHKIQNLNYNKMSRDEIHNNLSTSLERKLFKQLKEERVKLDHEIESTNKLSSKLEKYMEYKSKYSKLKKDHLNLKKMLEDELSTHIQMQKSIEQEAVYLAARKANLEEEREDLLNLLDQRDYEITMLQQQMTLTSNGNSNNKQNRTNHAQTITNQQEATFADELDGMQFMQSNDIDDDEDNLDDLLNDLDDDFIDDLDNDESDIDLSDYTDNEDNDSATNNLTSPRLNKVDQSISVVDRNKKAFDKIKEYLHLTASAVKIKYPTIKTIQSDALIQKVKELPFYKYHDQMVRIMDNEIKKIREKEKNTLNTTNNQPNNDSDLPNQQPKRMERRKSFLSIFNIFGGKDDDDKDILDDSDDEENDQKDKEENDYGISESGRRRRGGSTSNISSSGNNNSDKKKKRKKKKSFKRKKRASVSSNNASDENETDPDNKSNLGGQTRYKRGVSVQASQKRLNMM